MHTRQPVPSVLAFASCAFLAMACSGPGRDPSLEQSGRAFAGRTLAVILPDSTRIEARDPAAVAEAFPGEHASAPAVLAREFGEAFYAGLAPALDYVVPVKVPDSLPPAPADRSVNVASDPDFGSKPHTWSAPDSAWLGEHGVAADLVLIIGPLAAGVSHEDFIAPKFGGSLRIDKLNLEGWYLIWDYKAGRPLAKGRFRPTVEFKRKTEARDWVKAFDKAVTQVGEASPFRGPKWYHR